MALRSHKQNLYYLYTMANNFFQRGVLSIFLQIL